MVSLAEIDPVAWRDLVRHSPPATVFHTLEWLRFWQTAFPSDRVFFITVPADAASGSSLAAGMPVVAIKKKFFTHFFSLPRGCYGGPLVRDPSAPVASTDMAAVLDRFISETKRSSGMVELVDFSGLLDRWNLVLPGFHTRVGRTHILDIGAASGAASRIWERNLDGKVRNQIRQSERQGVEITPVETDADVDACWRMYQETDRRHGRAPVYDRGFYRVLFETIGRTGFVHWTIARRGNMPIANAIFLGHGDMVFHWNGASLACGWEFRPNNGLMWEAIRWACERGFRRFNFGGSPADADGLVHLKEGFGGRETRYPAYRRATARYALLQRLRGRR